MISSMAVVWSCAMSVEEYADVGRAVPVPGLRCPRCRTPLRPDGGYPRRVRLRGRRHQLWVRRGRCARCATSHALLPDFVVAHRLDTTDTIAAALHGQPDPTLPASTVAGWRRRWHTNHPDLVAGTGAALVSFSGTAPAGAAAHSLAALVAALWLAVHTTAVAGRRRRGGSSTPSPARPGWRAASTRRGPESASFPWPPEPRDQPVWRAVRADDTPAINSTDTDPSPTSPAEPSLLVAPCCIQYRLLSGLITIEPSRTITNQPCRPMCKQRGR